ncbi:MAG: hypothetical protein JXM74_00405 [Fusobacteriaceae bacterium]|nr:hypothetical protein [Fusobacteriaceae bacterium]
MNVLLFLMKFFFVFSLFFLILIVFLSYLKIRKSKIETEEKNMLENLLLEGVFSGLEQKKIKKIKYLKKNVKYSDIFVEKSIEIINSLEGRDRRNLILLLDQLKISKYVFNKYQKTLDKGNKEFYLYQLGELRSKVYLDFILNIKINEITSTGVFRGYFFTINAIIIEWIDELSDEIIKKYIDKIFEILEFINENNIVNIQKFLEMFLAESTHFVKIFNNNKYLKKHILKLMVTKNISLIHKGEIIFMIASNNEYQISSFIKKEFNKYYKENVAEEELEYIILLVKAAGEIGKKEIYSLLEITSKSNNWILQTIAAKYLSKFENEKTASILYEMVFHSNWWVRYNSALSLEKMKNIGSVYLEKILNSEDKYAREVSAYVIVNGESYKTLRDSLVLNGTIKGLNKILLIINKICNLNLLDKMITDNSIEETLKIELIEELEVNDFVDFYNKVLKFKNLSITVIRTCEKKIIQLNEINKVQY